MGVTGAVAIATGLPMDRSPASRLPFMATLTLAATDVALLLLRGSALRRSPPHSARLHQRPGEAAADDAVSHLPIGDQAPGPAGERVGMQHRGGEATFRALKHLDVPPDQHLLIQRVGGSVGAIAVWQHRPVSRNRIGLHPHLATSPMPGREKPRGES